MGARYRDWAAQITRMPCRYSRSIWHPGALLKNQDRLPRGHRARQYPHGGRRIAQYRVVGGRRIFVSNATNDNISVIDQETGEIATHIDLKVPGMERLRGILPFGMAFDKNNLRLYVACSGLNAVAVIDTEMLQLLGYIPAGWFCSAVEVSRDGRQLYIASAKGSDLDPTAVAVSSPPSGARIRATSCRASFRPFRFPTPRGSQSIPARCMPIPSFRGALLTTAEIRCLRRRNASKPDSSCGLYRQGKPHLRSGFRQRQGVRGDPTNTDLGMKMSFQNQDKSLSLRDVDVSPNHHALADRFAISDNFYCDSDQSNTGHRWVVGVYPNEWVEVNARSRIEARLFSSAPGVATFPDQAPQSILRITTRPAPCGNIWRAGKYPSSTSIRHGDARLDRRAGT